MTDKNLTEIICVVDRSGSMAAIKTDAIGGFNQLLEDQKKLKVGRALLTFVQFDHEYEVVHNGKPIEDVPPLTEATYIPRGCTALLDAVGKAIQTVGERLSKTPEDQRPAKVLVVILTDGLENASREYTKQSIKAIIDTQRNQYQWEFVYLGANQDAFAEAQSIGIQHSTTFDSTGPAVRHLYGSVSRSVSSYRSNGGWQSQQ